MCAITGVYSPDGKAAFYARRLNHEQQHRGQDTTGIATLENQTVHLLKAEGKVNQVFNEKFELKPEYKYGNAQNIRELAGNHAVGHNRYKTIGIGGPINAQPFTLENERFTIIMSHNGHVNNYETACKKLNLEERMQKDWGHASDCDVNAILYAFADGLQGKGTDECIRHGVMTVFAEIRGAYTISAAVHDKQTGETVQVAFKDPLGIRPGFFGRMNGSYAIASETFALERCGFWDIKPIWNGELITIGKKGITRERMGKGIYTPCQFEMDYFSKAGSALEGKSINHGRYMLGKKLGEKIRKEKEHWPHSADFVTYVPNTPIPIAAGMAKVLGMGVRMVMEKDPFEYEREFIKEEGTRHTADRLSVHWDPVAGKDFILADDSIVRGDTLKTNIALLRTAGANNIFVASSYPAIRHTCDMGIDMKTQTELVAHNRTEEEICKHIGADDLIYLTQEEFAAVLNAKEIDAGIRAKIKAGIFNPEIQEFVSNGNRCNACVTGKNPTHD